MSEANDSTPANGEVASNGGAAGSGGAATVTATVAPTVAARKTSAATKLTTHPKVQRAIALAKTHPLGAVATVAAAAALVEVEFAVGILTGLGATALLARRTGPEARERVIKRGKEALAQARVVIAKRRKPADTVASAVESEAAPPPAE